MRLLSGWLYAAFQQYDRIAIGFHLPSRHHSLVRWRSRYTDMRHRLHLDHSRINQCARLIDNQHRCNIRYAKLVRYAGLHADMYDHVEQHHIDRSNGLDNDFGLYGLNGHHDPKAELDLCGIGDECPI